MLVRAVGISVRMHLVISHPCVAPVPVQGTLFRFPLRTETQAARSQISKQVGPGTALCRTPPCRQQRS